MNKQEINIQPYKFAGSFYSKNPDELNQFMQEKLGDKKARFPGRAKAVIMPHAGYIYSGGLAALAAKEFPKEISSVVILSPSHRYGFRGAALTDKNAFQTPLGPINVLKDYQELLANLPFVKVLPEAFENEHGIEVELPWLQEKYNSIEIAPIVIGECSDEDVAKILERLWGDESRLIIISTDLSHFLDQKSQIAIDTRTAAQIEMQSYSSIERDSACGYNPLRGFLRIAQTKGMRLTRLGLANSAIVNGDLSRVVGYGAWVGHLDDDAKFADQDREQLYNIAAKSIYYGLENGKPSQLANYSSGHVLQSFLASFVSLSIDGNLRGCIGSLRAHRPLASDVFENAYKSAFNDRRFPPLTKAEFDQVDAEISVLSRPKRQPISSREELLTLLSNQPLGLIVSYKGKVGTFLPSVWSSLKEPEDFVTQLWRKAGLPKDFWDPSIEIYSYQAEKFEPTNLKNRLNKLQKT